MKDLGYIPCPSWKVFTALLYTAIIDLEHIDKLRMLCIRTYCILLGRAAWAGWSGRDLNLPCHVHARLNREIPPEHKLAKESKLRESPYIIDSPQSLLC